MESLFKFAAGAGRNVSKAVDGGVNNSLVVIVNERRRKKRTAA